MTTTLTETERTIGLYRRAVAAFDAHVAAVRPDHWNLPTPCTEWDVRALVNHVAAESRWAPPLLAGATIAEVGDRFDGDVLGSDPVAGWREAAQEALAAVAGEDLADVTVHASFGDIPATMYVAQLFGDVLIHTWDLARAIGADSTLAPELVEACYAMAAPLEDAIRSSGQYGEHVEVPADADPQTRLLALVGRRAEDNTEEDKERDAMHATPSEMPIAAELGGFTSRLLEWGGMTVEHAEAPAGLDPTELLADALPTGRCESPHWGYLVKGRVRIRYADHEEVVTAGQVYYAAPGHIQVAEEDSVSIEFSPTEAYKQTGAAIEAYLGAHPERLEALLG